MEYKKLSNGVKMPVLGYGTLHIPPSISESCTLKALQEGYRLIDTAPAYFNEKEVGAAILKSNIPREDIFVTTKVWIQDAGYEKTKKAFATSLANLGLEYLDLYFIHQPYGDYYGAYKAMEELYKEGKIRAIGVCNFSMDRFVDLYMNCEVKPMINQIEFHPFFQQKEASSLLKKHHCQMQAWGPLNEGQRDIFHHQTLVEIAKKHHKSVAQVILRWHLQCGVITIPKTIHEERMKENMQIFDFILDDQDCDFIKELDIGYSEIINHQCYTTAKRLNSCKIKKGERI